MASINKSDAAFVNQILSHLEEVLNIRCRRLEDELVVYTCRTHLHTCRTHTRADLRAGARREARRGEVRRGGEWHAPRRERR